MDAADFPIQQPGDTVTCPVPSAGPEVVARWLRRVRIGALVGLAVVVADPVYAAFVAIGLPPGPRLANTIVCARAIAEGIGIWLLVSSEPHNRKWLWPCRWALRSIAVALALLAASSIVVFGFFRNLPEHRVNDADRVGWMSLGVIGGWSLLSWYLARLSHRLGDKTLRKNFAAVFWLSVAGLILGLLVLTCQDKIHDRSDQSSFATAPAKAQLQESRTTLPGLAFWMAYCVWQGWLMWRLSRRLNRCAGHYEKLCALAPTTDKTPTAVTSG